MSTSEVPMKANFSPIRLKFLVGDTGSDTKISGAKKEENNFPTYAWVLLIASHLRKILQQSAGNCLRTFVHDISTFVHKHPHPQRI